MRGKPLLIWIAAGAWAALCLGSMLAATGGRLSMPLDDSYIFFQYARRLAEGAPFSYQSGDGVTAGVTSLLTLFTHGIGYLIGFRGPAMSIFALLLGAAAFAWAGQSALRLGRRLCPRVAWLPPALVLTSGPLGWGFMSGMDLPLFVALALAFAADWPEPGERPTRRLFIWGALLGLARPDAVFFILPAILFGLSYPGRRAGWAIPLAGVVFPFALQLALTGRPESASMDVKSVLKTPGLSMSDWFAGGLSYLNTTLRGVMAGASVQDASAIRANDGSGIGFFLVPFALPLFLLGLLPGSLLELRARRPGVHALLLAWAVLLVLAVSFTVPRTWHWHRYLIPVYPLVLLGAAVGAERLGRGVESFWRELREGDGARLVGIALVLLSLPGAAYFIVAYGRNCADIRFQHIELAQSLGEGTPRTPRLLGLHDAGALAYFGDYRTLDLEGLTSARFRGPARLGAAGVWEELERMPAGDRPDMLAFYPGWFDPAFLQPHRLIHAQRVFRQSIAAGNPLNVYLADWSLAGSGDLPRAPSVVAELAGARLVAAVDVADLSSEKAAGYRFHALDGAYQNLLQRLDSGDGAAVMDGGRVVSGGESFSLRGVAPGRPVVLVMRSSAPFRLRVETGEGFRGIWSSDAGAAGVWAESAFTLPESSVRADRLTLRLSSDDPHHSAYGSFHYWIYQR
jgi:hypothetical protein